MYTRILKTLTGNCFLFGPRGIGKSTWLKKNYPKAHYIDLLPSRISLKYEKNPSLFEAEILTLKKNTIIIVDEIQKVPSLTDEIHNLIENHGYKNFILTGSSARKLKRGSANMLAGRARLNYMFPLTSEEIKYTHTPDQILRYGLLPMSMNASSDEDRIDFLESYLITYIKEEIKAEALVKNIGAFSRFIEVCALASGSRINFSNIARDTGVSRDTVRGYFEVLEDTLLARWLPAYRPRAKIKEVASPKFYLFDSGVLNVAANAFNKPMPQDWDGILFEHWIFHELSAFIRYNKLKGELCYWATPSGSEVDFIWASPTKIIAIEVKSAKKYNSDFLKGIHSLKENLEPQKSFVVYQGTEELLKNDIHILPVFQFLKLLWKSKIF